MSAPKITRNPYFLDFSASPAQPIIKDKRKNIRRALRYTAWIGRIVWRTTNQIGVHFDKADMRVAPLKSAQPTEA
jgi:hypothetical protein